LATVSIGVAALEERIASYREWLEQADKALYPAKAQGRNRTVCCAV
jgi:diguanylate cyclase (GGDEF)-like protein